MNLAHRLLRLTAGSSFCWSASPRFYRCSTLSAAHRVSPEVRKVYDYLEQLPVGSLFLLSFDFEPGGKPELYPMAIALLQHAFRKNLKVLGMTLWPAGTGLAETAFPRLPRKGKEKGKDYAFLGYAPGDASAVISMGQDFHAAFPTDYYGVKTTELPISGNIHSLRDVHYVISLSVGFPGIEPVRIRQRNTASSWAGAAQRSARHASTPFSTPGKSMVFSVAYAARRSMKFCSAKREKPWPEWMLSPRLIFLSSCSSCV